MVTTIAVVGVNGYGARHVTEALALAGSGTVRLIGLVDPRRPDSPAAPVYATLDELLDRQVPDIVAIATPIHTHASLATRALDAGAHVLLEKPPVASMAEFEALLAHARERGRAVQVGFQARGSQALAQVQAAIADGTIGRVVGVGGLGLWSRTREYYERAPWAGRRELDGVPVMDGVATNPLAHAVDLCLLLAGATGAADVTDLRIESFHAHPIETDDTTSIVATTAAGIPVGLGLTTCAPDPQHPTVTVHGTEGAITLDYTRDLLRTPAGTQRTTRRSLLVNLIEHLSAGVPLLCPLESTGPFMAVLEAIRTGPSPVAVDPGFVTWRGQGATTHAVIDGVEQWCTDVASSQRTFGGVGAPWAWRTQPARI